MPRTELPPRTRTSRQWIQYFEDNDRNLRPIPWSETPTLRKDERAALATSISEFQLGESSEGRHLIQSARQHAEEVGDHDYVAAMRLFIAEENRHSRDLGRFMDREGIRRLERSFADGVFRRIRLVGGLQGAITVLVTAEIIAEVYYEALRQATGSPVLRALCEQILRDEESHVRFQCERLGRLQAHRGRFGRRLFRLGHRAVLTGALVVVGWGHRRALAAGGFGPGRLWSATWMRARRAFQIVDAWSKPRSIPSPSRHTPYRLFSEAAVRTPGSGR